ncbi:MAG: hypothetical protein HYR67_13880 [Bacteroidetes bacterium]|nr:hypothetical protein [Bacteroidota bacterium]
MKTKNTVLTLVAIVISAFAFAANPSKMAVISQQKSGTFRLIYEGATAGKVTLKIYDSSGTTSFKALHVCKLTEGKYLVSISSDGAEEINIRIFDNDNNLVHNENRTVNGDLGVVYNLKEIGGKPVFMISNGTGKNQTIK